jgi:hypothetical protein
MNLSKIMDRLGDLENSQPSRSPLDLVRVRLRGVKFEDLTEEDQERVKHYANLDHFSCGLDSMAHKMCKEFLETMR